MFRSKKDVDAHVRDVFSKCTSENERLKLCFGIAKQYAGIKEFDSARRYMETFLGSNPVNAADGHKLMGDIQLELGDAEKALESYKLAYTIGNGKEALNRVCDLLTRGYGTHETAESKKKWFDYQKLSSGNANNSMNSSMPGNYTSSPSFVTPKRTSMTTGPPKSGFMHSPYTNGNGNSLVASASKSTGGNVDLQLRYLERRFDDGLGKILDQNSIVLEQMMRLKDEMKEMAEKIDQIAVTQEKLEAEIKEIQEKQTSIPAPAQSFQPQNVIPAATFHIPCRKCETHEDEARNALKEKASSSAAEVASLKEQMDRLEKLTITVIDKLPKEVPAPSNQFLPQARNPVAPVPVQTFSQPQPVEPKPEYTVWNPAVQPVTATKPLAEMLFKDPTGSQDQKSFVNSPEYGSQVPVFSNQMVKTVPEPLKPQAETQSVPLSQLFKKPEGTWNCAACYVGNDKDAKSCVACATVRPGYENEKQVENNAAPVVQPTFSFGFPPAPVAVAPKNTNTPPLAFSFNTSSKLNETPKKEEETASPFTGVNLAGKFSFADLAKNNNSSFGTGSSTPSFAGTGGQLFSSFVNKSSENTPTTTATANNTSGNADDGEDDFVPTAEFQPVIPLPPLVEVKKGDENENTIVEYRAKLYRFIEETKEWKERGVGNIKLLQSKEDERKSRVVMWREKVGKLACNFSLFPDIKVDHYQGNPKILLWKCQDHTEAPSWETFTLRFGNEENCKHFKSEMERLAKLTQKSSGESPESAKPISVKSSGQEPTKAQAETQNVPLSQLFKKPEGTWNCAACYVGNDKAAKSCVACATVRPGFENEKSVESTVAPIAQPTFSFGFPAAPAPATNAQPSMFSFNTPNKVDEPPKKGEEPSPFAGLNLAGKFSFADIAKNNNSSFTFGTGNSTPSFAGTGGQLFSSFSNKGTSDAPTTNNTSANAEDAVDGEDDFVPTAEFQPVIPLPPLVEVKKGDENENTIVEYRAKLYRFIEETKEWKERGVGNIKLLQSKEDERKSRVVMWREKVGKLACNFSLFPDIKVDHYQNNPKILLWKCQDHTEAPTWETFTLRFGNEDNCKHFKEEMERLAKLTQKSGASPDGKQVSVKTPTAEPQKPQAETQNNIPLSDLFKKAEGSWSCAACYLSNGKDAKSCIACATVRPGFEGEKPAESNVVPATQPTFSFGFPSVAAGTTNAPTSMFSFNTPKGEEASKKEDETASPFAGLNLDGKFSFADLAKNNNSSYTFGTGSGTPSFAGTGGQLFSSFVNKSSDDANAANNTSANAEDAEDDFVPTAEFQPVIPLPPLVEVKKGDENENLIVEYRAKLYRFVEETKEWKERGVGNIKLMQSKDDEKKSRVVMWREKIGKLACNFSLFPDIKIDNYQSNPKILIWKCQDHTEAPSWETFTLRFGNEENCKHFKEEMERLAKLTQKSSGESPDSGKQVSAKSSCPGCGGCDPDTFVMPNHVLESTGEQLIDLPLSPSSSQERLPSISLELVNDTTPTNSNSSPNNVQVVPEAENFKGANANLSVNNSFSSFSFSLNKTPEDKDKANTSLTSFQLKTPTFSFKSSDGVPSIFSPPSITANAGSNASSPFVSPFNQSALFNNSSSSPSAPLNFTSPTFQQLPAQSAVVGSSNNEDNENQEDEYEDVDEEDECMFEEDAHIFIQNEANSSDSFVDKGEGVIRVLYDGDYYCARLVVSVDGEQVTEHLVASDTLMNPAGDLTYEWNGICDYETEEGSNCAKSKIRAVFANEEAYQNFATVMADSLEFADQAGITEAGLLEEFYQPVK